MIKVLLLVAGVLLSDRGVAETLDVSVIPEAATVECKLAHDQSIYLYQEEKMVMISAADKNVVPLTLESFEVYRCPGCFGFKGFVEGQRYEGQTEGVYDENTESWDVFMDLSIDGGEPRRLGCLWRQRS